MSNQIEPLNCNCGAKARVRYNMPYTWVECKKKCGMHTGVYCDGYEQNDPEARRKAIADWNRMVKKNG